MLSDRDRKILKVAMDEKRARREKQKAKAYAADPKHGGTWPFEKAKIQMFSAVKVFTDKMPQGITRLSIQFIKVWMAKLGLPWPYMVQVYQFEELHLVTSFFYVDAKGLETVLKTDGFSVGYGGEGPCGLKKLLDEFQMVGSDPRTVKLVNGQDYKWMAKPTISNADPRD